MKVKMNEVRLGHGMILTFSHPLSRNSVLLSVFDGKIAEAISSIW